VGRLLIASSGQRTPAARRACAIAVCVAFLLGAAPAPALQNDFDASIDLRAVDVSAPASFLYGGGGKLRYDEAHQGVRLGSVRLAWRGDLTDTVRITAESVAYGDHDVHALDLTELALSWRPVPHGEWRSELKAGAFYPAISLEHRMRGWRSPYTLSASALNTWVGEELRTIGIEYNGDWLRQGSGHGWNVGVTGALFGWNDTAGVIVGKRGWALHDRQTTLFGKLGTTPVGTGIVDHRTLFYRDLDGKPGGYAGLTANWRGELELRALHYDNRADPYTFAPAIGDGGWRTVFDSLGARWSPDEHWTLMAQQLRGTTEFGRFAPATGPPNHWNFDASYVLASWQQGADRLSVRYDDFAMRQTISWFFGFYNRDAGHALTAAWFHTLNARVTLAAEWLQLNDQLAARAQIGAPLRASERQLQLALRVEL
jgi:hypothetical protein